MVTTFGLGLLRPAPGTWGSMPTVAVAGALVLLGLGPNTNFTNYVVYNGVMGVILIVFSFACIAFGEGAEARFGKKDPGSVCADETAGQCLPLMFLPAHAVSSYENLTVTLVAAFLIFRVLDIIKPWPARQLQRLPAGWGVLIDDLVAGLQGLAIMQAVVWLAMK